jgi:hypothetical protein
MRVGTCIKQPQPLFVHYVFVIENAIVTVLIYKVV